MTLTSEILQIDPVIGAFTAPIATMLRDARSLAISAEGAVYTVAGGNYSLVVIDTGTAGVVRMGRFVNAELGQSIAFTPDGRLFAIGGQIAELDPFDAAIIGFPTSIPGDFRGVEFLGIQSGFRARD